jgi:peptidoglycan/LPS O-acetylase OafA/YrhL
VTVVVDPVRDDVRPTATEARTRRPEIDGLRGLAVALVVGYHVFTGRVSGGVDVFLVLTGFFLVHSLGVRYARVDGFNPVRPIARSLARLAPSAILVLTATALAALVFTPQTRWREIADHLISSVTFTENLRLVEESVDYAARSAATSPMQQFWSLSIQVQVLLALPFVVGGIGLLLRRAGWEGVGRPLATVLVAAATVASFAWAVTAVRADQQSAYFSTMPRLWEVGAGALAALLLAGRRPGRRLATVLGWTGVLALVACGAVIDGANTFPGWQAGWPVLAAVLVIVAADAGGRSGVHRLLAARPLAWLGVRSYGVYLWHWPILVLYLVVTDRTRPTALDAAAIIVSSVLLAVLTFHLVERPSDTLLRSRRPAWAVVLVIVCAAPLVAAGAATTTQLDRRLADFALVPDDPNYPGARALLDARLTAGAEDVELIPPLAVIRRDWARMPDDRCVLEDREDPGLLEPFTCTRGPDGAARRIVLVGDSHAAHWLHPLSEIVDAHDWQLVALINPGCNLSTESEFISEESSRYEQCALWRLQLVDRILEIDPDVVLALGTLIPEGEREQLPGGFVAAWEQLAFLEIPVIGLRDTPRHERDVPDCLADLGDDARECAVDPSEIYDDDILDAELPPGVQLLDTRPYFCTPTVCPSVIGNVRVYMDDAHVTNMYMRTIRPLLEPDLLRLTGF